MKKVLCLLAVLPLLLAGCGRDKVVLEGTGGEVYVDEGAAVVDKVKPDENGETKPPKVKDDTAVTPENTTTAPADPDNQTPGEDTSEGDPGEAPEVTDTAEASTDDPYKYHLDGIVLAVEKDTLLISEEDLFRISLTCDASQIKDVKVGDKVNVRYDGELEKGTPQKGKAHTVQVTEKASQKYELRHFGFRDLGFTVMVPESWTDRNIDYPKEGDFTDWGVRFQPGGTKGNIDVSWHSAFAIRDPYDKRKMKLNGYSVMEYSRQGKWKFLEYYDESFIVNNNFYSTPEYDDYTEVYDRIKASLEFDDN